MLARKIVMYHVTTDGKLQGYQKGRSVDVCKSTQDRKSTRLNSSHSGESRMPSSA